MIGVAGADVDLLDLERIVDFVEGSGGDEQRGIKVDVVEINRVVDFGEDADNDETFAEESEGFADWLVGAVEVVCEGGADDGGVGFHIVTEKGARFQGEVLDLDEVGVGANDGGGRDEVFALERVYGNG